MRHVITGALAAVVAAAVPYTFSPGTPARSAEVNANFSDLDVRLGSIASDLNAVKGQLAASGTGAGPAKVVTAETDFAQLEEGASAPAAGKYCAASVCVYRLTAGPFVLTHTSQTNPAGRPCITQSTCPENIGRIFYFPAPDDATAVSIAAATYEGTGVAGRWMWRSFSFDDVRSGDQTGVDLRYLVKAGESLYSYFPPGTPPGTAPNDPVPPYVFVGAIGYWSGYHPY